mmetsp:Transcript_108386/g.336839  ORF Transcript_108386/g.336839 Transcript_108386/m.336839 type:complete len:306 (-) Transcript_108386:414-1331(-)
MDPPGPERDAGLCSLLYGARPWAPGCELLCRRRRKAHQKTCDLRQAASQAHHARGRRKLRSLQERGPPNPFGNSVAQSCARRVQLTTKGLLAAKWRPAPGPHRPRSSPPVARRLRQLERGLQRRLFRGEELLHPPHAAVVARGVGLAVPEGRAAARVRVVVVLVVPGTAEGGVVLDARELVDRNLPRGLRVPGAAAAPIGLGAAAAGRRGRACGLLRGVVPQARARAREAVPDGVPVLEDGGLGLAADHVAVPGPHVLAAGVRALAVVEHHEVSELALPRAAHARRVEDLDLVPQHTRLVELPRA